MGGWEVGRIFMNKKLFFIGKKSSPRHPRHPTSPSPPSPPAIFNSGSESSARTVFSRQ
ncbi:hypothetical protein M595_2823 [Lyngbya aestuarii BL J]|uniref:Uncharacterized protein n=1 Tax=Lyngbya aestuarii BL J TaxID=1348334 RepID=U7QJJ4_9CYAN|nr:hypothetical protein M595_2823 [Lyngbya aestuarii BL J]